ncbi:SpoVR family protein, partial [Bacillus pumilus]|uniref:SpoVR family protein n=1 Tax=Bacillus pumilus TaxID=1408 RepID=UPI001642D3D0
TPTKHSKEYHQLHPTKQLQSFLHPLFPLHHHIHPSLLPSKLSSNIPDQQEYQHHNSNPQTPYDDVCGIDDPTIPDKNKILKPFPPNPQKHILLFIHPHSPELHPSHRHLLTMLSHQILYFS